MREVERREAPCTVCGLVAGVLCCIASAFVPALLLLSFEAVGQPISGPGPYGYIQMPNSDCRGDVLATVVTNASEGVCAALCNSVAECGAFVYLRLRRKCVRKSSCSQLRPSSRHTTYLRPEARPSLAPELRWKHNATLVLAWRQGDLQALATLPLSVLDLVVYRAHGGGAERHESRSTVELPKLPIAYFSDLPLGNMVDSSEGRILFNGLVAVLFTRTFYRNLPPLVLFGDGSCATAGCVILPPMPIFLARLAQPAELPAAASSTSAPAWQQPAGCLCRPQRVGDVRSALPAVSARRADSWERWYSREFFSPSNPDSRLSGTASATQLLQEAVATGDAGARSRSDAMYPSDGIFAVSGWRLQQRPVAFYGAWWQLLMVDQKYAGLSGRDWASILMRQWFRLLHTSGPPPASPGAGAAAAPAGTASARPMSTSASTSPGSSFAAPTDECFAGLPYCDPSLPTRLRTRSAELLRRGVGAMRERMRGLWSGRAVRSHRGWQPL